MVVSSAPMRAVRTHRLLRLLAGTARLSSCRGDRTPFRPQLRARRELVLGLRQRRLLRRAAVGAAGASPARPAGAGSAGSRAGRLDEAPALTDRPAPL